MISHWAFGEVCFSHQTQFQRHQRRFQQLPLSLESKSLCRLTSGNLPAGSQHNFTNCINWTHIFCFVYRKHFAIDGFTAILNSFLSCFSGAPIIDSSFSHLIHKCFPCIVLSFSGILLSINHLKNKPTAFVSLKASSYNLSCFCGFHE